MACHIKTMLCTIGLLLAAGCSGTGQHRVEKTVSGPALVAHLQTEGAPGFEELKVVFEQRNPGYGLEYLSRQDVITPCDQTRIVFIHSDGASGTVLRVDGTNESSDLVTGDVVTLRPGERFGATTALDMLIFEIPQALDDGIPSVIRPDWDPAITDTPGGCATDPGAYRRLLLTWDPANGPYVHHGLNCHRVRIDDSFTHMHPSSGGFDEFYLVQGVQPGARVLTYRDTPMLQSNVHDDQHDDVHASDLLVTHTLWDGDLVLMPRGLTHRGLGGATVQVIAVPGFRPGAEVAMDESLHRFNQEHQLYGREALPVHGSFAETTP